MRSFKISGGKLTLSLHLSESVLKVFMNESVRFYGYLALSRYLSAKLSKESIETGLCWSGAGLYSAVWGATLSALMEVVFPPQSTYWYISWDTCSAWPKYVVVTVTLRRRWKSSDTKNSPTFQLKNPGSTHCIMTTMLWTLMVWRVQ